MVLVSPWSGDLERLAVLIVQVPLRRPAPSRSPRRGLGPHPSALGIALPQAPAAVLRAWVSRARCTFHSAYRCVLFTARI